jgi:predicted TIM-barrel fold metal-dependent hydrolase
MNIDADTHFTPREVVENLPREMKDLPQLIVDHTGKEKLWLNQINNYHWFREEIYSVKMRIDAMKEAGFDKEVLLVANGTIPETFLSTQSALFLMRRWNDAVAKVEQKHDCFIGAAQIPHSDPDAAIGEAERAVKDLGFRAIQIQGNWMGKNIESYDWWPFFEKVERLGVPIWYHATGAVAHKKFNPYLPGYEQITKLPPPTAVFHGFLWEAQLILTGLILNGVIDKYPGLKVVLTEVDASWVPHFMSLLDSLVDLNQMYKTAGILENWDFGTPVRDIVLRKKPSQRVRENFYFAINNATKIELDVMLPVLVNRMMMANNLMIESDYDHPEGTLDIVRRVRTLKEIDEESKDMICGKNAANLLKIEWAPSAYVWA